MSHGHRFLFVSAFFCLALLSSTVHAKKTDVVVLENGDAVTGEIKELEFGSLRYGTDSMGTVSIEWEEITGLRSNQQLQIEVTDGSRFFGSLVQSQNESTIRVKTTTQEVVFRNDEVVRITPIEISEKFWQNLDGSISLGFQTQKSSGVTTSNVAADISHRAQTYLVGLKLNSSVTDQPTETTKARQSIEGNFQRFRQDRWFTEWFARLERNDELGINTRLSSGGALGRYIIQNNMNQLSLTAGVQAARSSFIGEDETTTVAEGRVELRYLHRNRVPESSITLTSVIYPLLENPSEYRAETDLSFQREFISDLFFSLSVGQSYTSTPPTGAAKSDYNIVTALGYSF